MLRNYNVEFIFAMKRIGIEDRKIGMQGMSGNVRECLRKLGNDGDCKEMFRNDDGKFIFSEKKRIGMEDRKVGMQGMLGKVCMEMLGKVWECQGMLETDRESWKFLRMMGNVWIGMEDRKVGIQGILGKVCKGMLGNVGELWGILGNNGKCFVGNVGKYMH